MEDRTCPYCEARPMGKRKNAATCGDKACQQARNRERMDTDEWRERMRDNMRAKRAAGMETESMEDRTCEVCGCTYRVEVRRAQRTCSQKCNAATQDMKALSRLAVRPCPSARISQGPLAYASDAGVISTRPMPPVLRVRKSAGRSRARPYGPHGTPGTSPTGKPR